MIDLARPQKAKKLRHSFFEFAQIYLVIFRIKKMRYFLDDCLLTELVTKKSLSVKLELHTSVKITVLFRLAFFFSFSFGS